MEKDFKKLRHLFLKKLIDTIINGDFEKLKIKEPAVYNKYESPYDRSGYNYGYMTSGEVDLGEK